jgi:hypothetical protein
MRKALVLGGFAALVWAGSVAGQAADAALRDRVAQLVQRLGGEDAAAREAAEKSLVQLGPRVLPLLPEVKAEPKTDREKLLVKVREALIEAQESASLGASKVTIQGKSLRLTDVLKQLQTQSGNTITDLREEATNPAFDLDIKDKSFYEALDEILNKGGVTLQLYTGDGTVGLMAADEMMEGQPTPEKTEAPPPSTYTQYAGPFRVIFKQFDMQRNFATGKAAANAQFEIAWEPRLRPMLLALKAEEVKIEDDRGQAIPAAVTEETSSVVLRPENPVAEMNLNLDAPDRMAGVKTLKSLKVKADVNIPAGLRTFRFPKLDATNATETQGDVKVTMESVEVDESVWKINVSLEMPGDGPAFESYRQGLFNNRLWLQKPDGSRFEHNGGFSNTASDGGKLSFEYLFVDVPGKPADYQFVYETPSRVRTIPLEFEFKDVPLP